MCTCNLIKNTVPKTVETRAVLGRISPVKDGIDVLSEQRTGCHPMMILISMLTPFKLYSVDSEDSFIEMNKIEFKYRVAFHTFGVMQVHDIKKKAGMPHVYPSCFSHDHIRIMLAFKAEVKEKTKEQYSYPMTWDPDAAENKSWDMIPWSLIKGDLREHVFPFLACLEDLFERNVGPRTGTLSTTAGYSNPIKHLTAFCPCKTRFVSEDEDDINLLFDHLLCFYCFLMGRKLKDRTTILRDFRDNLVDIGLINVEENDFIGEVFYNNDSKCNNTLIRLSYVVQSSLGIYAKTVFNQGLVYQMMNFGGLVADVKRTDGTMYLQEEQLNNDVLKIMNNSSRLYTMEYFKIVSTDLNANETNLSNFFKLFKLEDKGDLSRTL